MSGKIYVSKPHLSGNEEEYIKKALDSNWITTQGFCIDKFESTIETYVDYKKKVLALNSGTSALHLALILLGVSEGDEIICQTFTFNASANPILYQRAIPVFVDSEKDTWNMCPDSLEEAIEDRLKKGKKPKAIIAVDSYGMPAKWDEILAISIKHGIPVIEDSAEALGSSFNNQKCGTYGELSVFSFNGNKIITTSSGGALLCNTEDEKEEALIYSTQAKDPEESHVHKKLGYNYRMSNILAGLGLGQFEHLKDRVAKRRANNLYYKAHLNSEIFSLQTEPSVSFYSNFWLSCALIKAENFAEIQRYIRSSFQENNIEYRRLWYPLHKQPIFSNYKYYGNHFSEELFSRGFCLPSASNLSQNELDRVVKVLNNFKERTIM